MEATAPCLLRRVSPLPPAAPPAEEPRRFARLIDALAKVWADGKATLSPADAATATLPYLPLVRA